MAFQIRADFLLGFYQGHNRRGVIEPYPSVLRLHAALVAGAYSSRRLANDDNSTDGIVELTPATETALHWLEWHAPDAVSLPRFIMNEGGTARAFRDKGDTAGKKASELAITRSELDGPVIWWWEEEPPELTQKALLAMCAEVPYLGETASPVLLTSCGASEIDPNAYRREDSTRFSAANAVTFAVPREGRAAALQEDYAAHAHARIPTIAQDAAMGANGRPHTSEAEKPDVWDERSVNHFVTYALPRSEPRDDSPWTEGILIRATRRGSAFAWPPPPEERKDWAVAFHRALVSRLGIDAPPLVTGRYPDKNHQPANRVSIQILDGGMDIAPDLRPSEAAFLVAIPKDSSADDIDMIQDAAHGINLVTRTGGDALGLGDHELIDTANLWKPPADGSIRWWFPHPLVVSDSRSPRRSALQGKNWTIEDVLRVAVGNVFRDLPRLLTRRRRDERLVQLSALVDGIGVRVGAARRSYPLRPERYVHHMNRGAAVITVQGLIHMGTLTVDRAFMALGQSRHLGGGLLVPFDLPQAVVSQELDPEETHE